jgi:epoxyqueuosine reductase
VTLEDAIKARARQIGFDLVGITTADPFPDCDAAYQMWLDAGMHAGMDYMVTRRGRAAYPQQVRAGTRSIVAVAMNYYAHESGPWEDSGLKHRGVGGLEPQDDGETRNDDETRHDGGPRGRTARYAWGDDYHPVMEARLRSLAGFLVERGAGLARYYVDTGPLFERAIAQRAGLGWFGRHSCLITGQYGTWVVLGEILTDLALRPDPPASGDCGLCSNCTNGTAACPTGAIVGPGIVDARLCISYWTIEHRGWIPREIRPAMGDMIFGCDICQEACPFNRVAKPAAHTEFRPRAEAEAHGAGTGESQGPDTGAAACPHAGVPPASSTSWPDTSARPLLIPLLNVSEDDFRRRFRRSAVRRAKRSGLRRNVAVALGNLADPRAVPALGAAVCDPGDPVVRGHAAWALGRIGGEAARSALEEALRHEEDPDVRGEIVTAVESADS